MNVNFGKISREVLFYSCSFLHDVTNIACFWTDFYFQSTKKIWRHFLWNNISKTSINHADVMLRALHHIIIFLPLCYFLRERSVMQKDKEPAGKWNKKQSHCCISGKVLGVVGNKIMYIKLMLRIDSLWRIKKHMLSTIPKILNHPIRYLRKMASHCHNLLYTVLAGVSDGYKRLLESWMQTTNA